MKKLVFAVCMTFGAAAFVNAQDSTSTTSPSTSPSASEQSATTAMQDEGRVKIKSQELPDAVKSSLEGQEYRGWLVSSVYKVEGGSANNTGSSSSTSSSETSTSETSGNDNGMGNDQSSMSSDSTSVGSDTQSSGGDQEVYIVELKNGAQTKTVRFDADGKKLDDGQEGMESDQK